MNPGAQKIGSFHPITEGDWSEGALIQEENDSLYPVWKNKKKKS